MGIFEYGEEDPRMFLIATRPLITGILISISTNKIATELHEFLREYSYQKYNLFFCPNSFSKPFRQKNYAHRTNYAWCDIDDSDPYAYIPTPSLLWETSPNKFQGLWLWNRTLSPKLAEDYSYSLANRHGGDKGHEIVKMLRIPGSINQKPKYDKPEVKMVYQDWTPITKRPKLVERKAQKPIKRLDVNPYAHDPIKVIQKYRKHLHPKARYYLTRKSSEGENRSNVIYFLICEFFEAGATEDEIASAVYSTPYADRYGDDLDRFELELSRILSKIGDE